MHQLSIILINCKKSRAYKPKEAATTPWAIKTRAFEIRITQTEARRGKAEDWGRREINIWVVN